jgi:hypothetical protein
MRHYASFLTVNNKQKQMNTKGQSLYVANTNILLQSCVTLVTLAGSEKIDEFRFKFHRLNRYKWKLN